jgi:hypothetical protein
MAAPHLDTNLSLIFLAQGWTSFDTSVIRYITSPIISCVRPLLDFFVVDPEAYKYHAYSLFIYVTNGVIELILTNLMHDMYWNLLH